MNKLMLSHCKTSNLNKHFFLYLSARYHLKDVIVGKIYFLLVRIKIQHMELQLIKKEITGIGKNPGQPRIKIKRENLSGVSDWFVFCRIIRSHQEPSKPLSALLYLTYVFTQWNLCPPLQVPVLPQRRRQLLSMRSWTELQLKENQSPSDCSWLVRTRLLFASDYPECWSHHQDIIFPLNFPHDKTFSPAWFFFFLQMWATHVSLQDMTWHPPWGMSTRNSLCATSLIWCWLTRRTGDTLNSR